ncbi:MAG: hypothetical protein N2C14_07105, partial [Planctomycetales bacterium]
MDDDSLAAGPRTRSTNAAGDQPEKPYLSVVVTSRNDNHGGALLQRMQTFVNALAEISDQVDLPVELIFVEWNPPSDRPRLAEALRWPESRNCVYRIIEVPPEIHRRYESCGPHLPLFQMIAKNVGIRRAQGEFVLATNVDLIFSRELMEWLADRRLTEGAFYRIDRYDVPVDVMDVPSVDEQLAYCKQNLIRACCRYGTLEGDLVTGARQGRFDKL